MNPTEIFSEILFRLSIFEPICQSMTNPDQILTLCDLRAAITQGRVKVMNRDVAIAYLDLAEDALGDEFRERHHAAKQHAFEARFPDAPDAALIRAFIDETTYARWRRNVAMYLCFAGLTDATEPFEKLNLFAKRDSLLVPKRQVLERAWPGLHPRDITRAHALEADRGLTQGQRPEFRRSIRALDALRKIDAVCACGLLSAESIGSLPDYADGNKVRVELPPQLQDMVDTQSIWDRRRVRRLFEIGVHADLLDAKHATPADFVDGHLLRELYNVACETTSKATASNYMRALFHSLEMSLPETLSARLGAIDPRPGKRRDARRERAMRPAVSQAPSQKGRGKDTAQPLPDYVRAALTDFEHATAAPSPRLKNLRTILRRFSEDRPAQDLAALLDDAQARVEDLLAHCTETTRAGYRRDLTAFLVHVGLADEWLLVSQRASRDFSQLFCGRGISLLTRLSADHVPPLRPRELSRKIVLGMAEELRRTGKHNTISRLNTGIACLDRLRPLMPDLLDSDPIGSLPDARRGTNVALPPRLEDALKTHAAEAGFTAYGTKAMLVAVRTLYSLADDRTLFDKPLDRIPFREILRALTPEHDAVIAPYRNEIDALATRFSIRWTRGWRKLQRCVVAAGTARCDNAVETLARIAGAQNVEPWQLDREWAWTHERGLRPDLRLTFARDIARFDALRDIAAIAQAGLMPTHPLGPMPPRGSRLKNAHLPLPCSFEAVLDGETKQVLEAAHFLWRCLREFGVYARGDDPASGDLVAEGHLEQVMAQQPFMTPVSARLHIARIRDWRESQPGLT